MSSPYTVLGPIPAPNTFAWANWVQALLAMRLRECPLARATTYYFSQAGDDGTGDGTKATPYKSISKANTLAAAGVALLFACGDTWRDNTPLVIPGACTVAAYIPATQLAGVVMAKPRLFIGATVYPTGSGWTNSGNAYYRTETNAIAAVRKVGDEFNPPAYDASTVTAGTTFKWFWDSGTNRLYVNPGGGVNISTVTIESFQYQSASGVQISGDGARVHGLRIDGGGIQDYAHQTQHTYGIIFTYSGTNAAVVSDCEVYYSGYHCIGTGASTTGGIFTVHGCTTGFQRSAFGDAGAGGSDIVFFGDGHEGLSVGNICKYGPLFGLAGQAILAHNGGTSPMKLMVEVGQQIPGGGTAVNQHTNIGAYGNLTPAAGVLSACRAFIFGRQIGAPGVPFIDTICGQITLADADVYQANGYINVKVTASTGQAQLAGLSGGNGWCVNTTVLAECANASFTGISRNQAAGLRQRFYNCYFGVINDITASFFFNTSGASGVDIEVKQCILHYLGGGNPYWFLDINNNLDTSNNPLGETLQIGNSYISIRRDGFIGVLDTSYRGASNDSAQIILNPMPVVGRFEPNESYLLPGQSLLVEYDQAFQKRTAAMVGPIAGPTAITLNTAMVRGGLGDASIALLLLL